MDFSNLTKNSNNRYSLMEKIFNITDYYWLKEVRDDMFWIDPKYEISLQISLKREM